jgi:predicted CopG family antitoxin
MELDLKTIKVSDDIHSKLVKRGRYDQTMNDIISELLKIAEERKK